jgi:hypothetical protein
MKLSVSLACEFMETLFIFETTHRIGNCNRRLLPSLCLSVYRSERRRRTRYVLRAFPNTRCYPLIYACVSQFGSGLTYILQDTFR